MRKERALALKRAVDVVGAGVGLVVLAPVLGGLAAVVWAAHGRPILFRQVRPGRGGEPFTIYKFRTMRAPRPGEIWFESNAQRLTPLGRFLRTTSLDELPELWNVLRGDMSLVGPRPLLVEYLPRYSPEQARRHDVLPGITGWAQVNGRNSLEWDARFQLDVWYVDHWSLRLDLKILALTLLRVAQRRGVSFAGDATMF